MSRVQLSINVTDFDAAVAFYSRLFGTAPAKLRPGYANFAIDDPPLKLVLNCARQRPRRDDQPPGRRGRLHRGGHQRRGPAGSRGPGHRARARHGLLLRPAGQGVGA